MPFDPFTVEVITKEHVTTAQKILTAVVSAYFFVGGSSVAIAIYFLSQSQ